MKPSLPLNGKARQIKTLKVRELNIGAGKVVTIILVSQIVSHKSGKPRAIVRKLDIFQPRLASAQAQVAGEGLEGFSIDCQFGNLQLAAALQVSQSAGGLQVGIRHTGNCIVCSA